MGIKHTPGPWVVDHMSAHLVRSQDDKNGRHIAAVGPANYTPRYDVDDANARLIAAAPELLEALECLLAKADIEFKNIWPETRNDARAAIAKAKGEEQ